MGIAELSDKATLMLLGSRVQRERLNRNLTQAELAERAGVGTRTVRYLEAGRQTTVETLIRILRALDKLDALDGFLPEPGLSPLQLAKLKGRERKRAGVRRRKTDLQGD
jgi:transcriptional regulator with XRE-family HTH domain